VTKTWTYAYTEVTKPKAYDWSFCDEFFASESEAIKHAEKSSDYDTKTIKVFQAVSTYTNPVTVKFQKVA
jgi:hypothetical protein